MAYRLGLIAVGAALALPLRATHGQGSDGRRRFELSAVVGHVSADGSDFSGTKGATGLGGTVRYALTNHLGLGVGLHYSDHGLESFSEHLHLRALYGELRYAGRLPTSRLDVFAGARGGWIHEAVTLVGWSANGWVAGGEAGVDLRLLSSLALELQLSETAIRLGDRRGADGSLMPGTAADGSSLGVEGGVVLRF